MKIQDEIRLLFLRVRFKWNLIKIRNMWKRTMFGKGYYWKEFKHYGIWILLCSGVMIALRYLESETTSFIIYFIYLLISTSWLFIVRELR